MNRTKNGTRRRAVSDERNMTRVAHNGHNCDAAKQVQALAKRVKELERSVAAVATQPSDEDVWRASRTLNEGAKRGPKPKHPTFIYSDRNELVNMLEDHWPELLPHCRTPVNPAALRHALTAIAKRDGHYTRAAQHLLSNFKIFSEFLAGDRFRNDPRQIANAMAGVPHVSTWRSLKLCGAKPCEMNLGERAVRAYIERKHHELYRAISNQSDLVSISALMRSYRTRDRHIACYKKTAVALEQAWRAGSSV